MRLPDEARSDLTIRGVLDEAAIALRREGTKVSLPEDAASLLAFAAVAAINPGFVGENRPPSFALADWPCLCDAAFRWLCAWRAELVGALSQTCHGSQSGFEALLNCHTRRLATLAADRLTAPSVAPLLRLQSNQPYLSRPIRAIIFESMPHFADEIAPLLVDAIGSPGVVVAAHASWLTESGNVRRAIWLDPVHDRLVEADLRSNQTPCSALLLLGPSGSERIWHRDLARQFERQGIRVLNSQLFAEISDDKWETYRAFLSAGIRTPHTSLVMSSIQENELRECVRCAAARAEGRGGFVVKPRHGTEGLAVSVCKEYELLSAAEAVLATGDDALIQPFENDLVWLDETGASRTAVLRINVARAEGGGMYAESGFLHVAEEGNRIASVGQRGRLLPIETVSMRVSQNGHLGTIPEELAALVGEIACSAVKAMEPMGATVLAGVDIALRAGANGVVIPIVLEINPRPAGLSHSRFLMPGWESAGLPGVSSHMWRL